MVNAGRLDGLQVARALAALVVAYYHSFAIFSTWPLANFFPIPGLKEHGYLGVNFFFAISGYVISLVCDKDNFSVREFLARRFFRLYPVYWCVVLAAILVKLLGVSLPRQIELIPILYSMTLLPHEGSDSFMIIPVAWSLEFEIMFYLLAALVVPFLRIWGLAAVLACLIVWAYAAPPEIFTFHLVRTLHSDFLAGVLAYLLRKPLRYIPPLVLIPCGLFGYYCAVVLLVPFSGSLGGLLAVSALANAKWRWDRWPLRLLVRVGDASYSMYLLHWVMIYVFVTVIAKIGVPPAWSAEPIRFAFLGVCCWLSFQAFRYIERPMIELGNRLVLGRSWSVALFRLTR
ncbi:acyltransferase [Bradyrhizobium sp. PRIMUS42]|uniref:acyltransferase family protein n=1 Tax=Bradyrhizobium sp. PRIMUS42 TaxID=2908926 RepID=UPI001FF5F06F|nr:acyltransferase [Bradyrhizobium sp. PRIMUS42]MCJ9729389.1 acyltransferase [Bradyrhizobium sp. PRIMUS42]